jgi:antitoxin component YwqK of YwqJK toxin-antitoxin module
MKGLSAFLAIMVCMLAASAQDVVPKAKTRAQQKAEGKKKSVKQQIEETLPVEISTPTPSLSLPGNNNINSAEDAKKFLTETMPALNEKAKKKLKKAKGLIAKSSFDGKKYEGIAVKKQIYKRGSNSRLVYQEFYVVKNESKPDKYARNIFWWNLKTKKVVEALTRDTKTNVLLHGPYKEYKGENLVSEGSYYLGTKHGRWLTYDKDFVLINKEYYTKGFLSEAKISYFDADSSKIKEVLPVLYGDTTGNYYAFFEDATLALEGKYENGKKIGKWVEYYKGGNRRKKETQYPADSFSQAEPYILRAYDENGKLTTENTK